MPLFSTHTGLILGLDIEFCIWSYCSSLCWRPCSIVSSFCTAFEKYNAFWLLILCDLPSFFSNLWKLLDKNTSYPECSEIINKQLSPFIHYLGINGSFHHGNLSLSFCLFYTLPLSIIHDLFLSRMHVTQILDQLSCYPVFLSFTLYVYYIFYYSVKASQLISKTLIDFLKSQIFNF